MNDSEFKKIVRKGFDEASAGYDKPAMKFFDHSAEHLVGSLALNGHEHLLDVATGTGKAAIAAARRLKYGHVTGVDLSEGMLQCAQAKAERANLKNILFKCSDIEELTFPENTFDGILCSFGMFFFSDMEGVLKKLIPAMKSGGCVAMTSFAGGSFRPLADLTLERFKQYGVKLPDSYTWQRLDSHEKHVHLLNAAGLKNISSYTKPMGYYLPDADAWWDIVTYTGFRSFLNQLSPDQVNRYKEEHHKEISQTADGKNGIKLNVDVIFTMGYR